MSILIIFFIILIIIGLLISFIKVNMEWCIQINNNNIKIKWKILNKEVVMERKIIPGDKSRNYNKPIKKELEFFSDVAKKTEIELLHVNAIVGTPYCIITVIIATIISTMIPISFALPLKKKKNLYFKVLPNFNEFILDISINTILKFTILNFIIIFLKFKKRKMNNFKK